MSFFTPASDLAQSKKPLPLVAQCGACGLWRQCKSPKMPVDGQGKKKILICGESPGRSEDEQGKPFLGSAGRVLWSTLRRFGVERDDCWTTNSARCFPPGGKYPKDTVTHCRPFLVQAVKELKPEVIILLGDKAVQSLIGWLWKEDNGNLARWEGQQIPVQSINCWVCPTYHPASSFYDDSGDKGNEVKRLFFERRLEAACQLQGRPWATVPDYRKQVEVVYDVDAAAAILDEFTEAGGKIAFDYETTCLKPDGPHAEIYCCSVCWEGKRTIAYPWHGAVVAATERLLRSPVRKLGQNVQFEQRWTKAKLGFWVKNWALDGMLGAHVLDSKSGATGLKFQAFTEFGVDAYDEKVAPYLRSKTNGGNEPNRIREAPLGEVLLYCGLDSLFEYMIDVKQAAKLGVGL